MLARQFIAAFGLITLMAAGCTAVPDPTPTPENSAGEVATVVMTRPLLTATLAVTAVPSVVDTTTPAATLSPTATDVARREGQESNVSIPIPSAKPTATPAPTQQPTPLPLHLAETIEEIIVLDNIESPVWSPAHNEFAYTYSPDCSSTTIYFFSMSTLQPVNLTPSGDLSCHVSFLWHPFGDFFLFSTQSRDVEYWGPYDGWKVNRIDPAVIEFGTVSPYWGWLNNDLYITEQMIGTGISSIGISDTETGEGISGTKFDGSVTAASNNYVILQADLSEYPSVAILSQDSISPEFAGWLHGTDVKFLSWKYNPEDSEFSYSAPSQFMDVLPETDQILVMTWQFPESWEDEAITSGKIPADLQMWDVDTDKLTMVIPDGIYGRFSPNGEYLVYIKPSSDFPQLELMHRDSQEIIFTHSAFIETDDSYPLDLYAFTSFSPDGRTLTFYSPTPELMLYDLENGEFLLPLTAVPFTPLWSPDSSRFVYQHPADGLSIFDRRTNSTYPLATSGGERLSDPQWSYDGTYLSVAVQQEDGSWDTAVLQIP